VECLCRGSKVGPKNYKKHNIKIQIKIELLRNLNIFKHVATNEGNNILQLWILPGK
jgi:hypothetical protein